MENPPHLVVSYREDISEKIAEEMIEVIKHPNLNLYIDKREKGEVFAGVEWLLPTTVMLILTRSYFDAFLKEMGKDHYNFLKKSVLKIWDKVSGKKRQLKLTTTGTKGKSSKNQLYSLAFSIMSQSIDEFHFKFLFEENLNTDECEKYISLIIKFLDIHHFGQGDIEDCILNEKIKHSGKTILIVFDKDIEKLRMKSPYPEDLQAV